MPDRGAPATDRAPKRETDGFDLGRFVGAHPTRDTDDWFRVWHEDRAFPIQSGRGGLVGRLVRLTKRLLRPIVRLGAAEAFERQRVFNLIVVEAIGEMRQLGARIDDLDRHLKQVHADHQQAIEAHARRLEELDVRSADGLRDAMGHNDALFARVDQKLDRYRREARHLHGRLGALVAVQETALEGTGSAPAVEAVSAVLAEQTYVELERRWRGSEDEIAARVSAYLPYLEQRGDGPVLDLGCGRGEVLRVLGEAGIEARGVDQSAAMVAHCRQAGWNAVEGDLFDTLAAQAEASLGAVISLHVIEHLPPTDLPRLVRLAWRALGAGGLLILETPSPLSLVASASRFWTDPTHVRPVHPAWLEVVYREAGFEPVHRLDLHPFPDDERLPEIATDDLDGDARALADRVNRLRDRIDDTLYGCRDVAMIGVKAR